MKSKLCFAASALGLIVGLVSIALFMEMYDVQPQTWGPQRVEFDEWHRVWSARRDWYVVFGAGSLTAAVVLFLAGVARRNRGITKPCS
jgi:hypothetical protein